jgi:hypothetical protein
VDAAARPWSRLDNAAKIFPAVSTDRLTNLFRLSVCLDQPVSPDALTRALHAVLPRFPSFCVRLKPGFFWYSLVEDLSLPPVYAESMSPCLPFRHRPRLLFRVRWFGRRLAVEFSHSLTDGVGASLFLRALVAEYLGDALPEDDPDDVRRLRTPPDSEESADAFQDLYDPTFPGFKTWDRAYQPEGGLLPPGSYAVTSGSMPLSEALGLAKRNHATLTEFLAATLLASFQDGFLALPERERRRRARPLRLVLPVNLRPIFPSKTLRNFFVVIPVEIDLRLGPYAFEEIVRKVHHQLQAEMDPQLLKKQIMRNLRGELNPVARLLPLPAKALVLRSVFGAYERQHTASLSNLGRLVWPPVWSSKIRGADFTPPPSPYCRVNAGVVSFGGTLSVTFGNLSDDATVERAFFTRLRRLGLPVAVESNRALVEE